MSRAFPIAVLLCRISIYPVAMSWAAAACEADCTSSYSVEVVALPYCGFPGYGLGPQKASDGGNIVGAYGLCNEQTGAFLAAKDQGVAFLNLGQATSAIGNDINSKLQIVGTKEGPTGHVGFLYEQGITTELGFLPNTNLVEANAINESGLVVGLAAGNKQHAFTWQNGSMSELVLPVGPSAVAFDVNDSGQIVGWMGVAPFPPFYGEAFVWDNGKTTPLGYPSPGTNSEARAISNNGQVCGAFVFPNPQGGPVIRRAFHWSNGVMTDIGTLPGFTKSFGIDVNDAGQVVGYCTTPGPSRAFVWQNGVMSNLNDFIPSELGLTLIEGMSISNNGQILCQATGQDADYVAVLLTPKGSTLGDFNCDNIVNVDDLLGVISNWGASGGPADLNSDKVVNVDDLLIVLTNWS